MKRAFTPRYLTVIIVMLCSAMNFTKLSAQSHGGVSFELFYRELSPYGQWNRDPHHGDMWFPNVSNDFRPYGSNGYWTMTDYGNTWISNYDWGWAPFHYGRWVHTPHRGWGWIPGYEWGPGWVEWRTGNGYYGWAPMGPRVTVAVNVPINMWIFIPNKHIYAHNIHRHWAVGRRNIYNRTTVINNTYIVNNHHYYGGPSRRDIEHRTGRRVDVHQVRYANNPGSTRVSNRAVSIYRPDRDKSSGRSITNSNRNNTRVNSGRTTVDRSDNKRNGSSTTKREMHIGSDGNATIRERNDGHRTANTTRDEPNNTVGTNASRRATSDRGAKNAQPARQRSRGNSTVIGESGNATTTRSSTARTTPRTEESVKQRSSTVSGQSSRTRSSANQSAPQRESSRRTTTQKVNTGRQSSSSSSGRATVSRNAGSGSSVTRENNSRNSSSSRSTNSSNRGSR